MCPASPALCAGSRGTIKKNYLAGKPRPVAEELHKIFGDILARLRDLTYASMKNYCSVKKMLNQSLFLWYKKGR
jgi:hypothetical protein